VGRANRLDLEGRSLPVDFVGDLAPTLGKVEVLGSLDGIVGQLDLRDTVDPEGPLAGVRREHS
jgi:hypothetical protein